MASPGDKKRKANEAEDIRDPSDPSPMARMLDRKTKARKTSIEPRRPVPEGVWSIGDNRYFYDNSLSLYEQQVEMLNTEYKTFMQQHPDLDSYYWYVCEYLRRIQQLKDLYQSPFIGRVLTCGLADMSSLGYDFSTTKPRSVSKNLRDLSIVKISCGSTFNIMTDIDGKVYTFGGQDEGGMGRQGEDYEKGNMQVRGFIPLAGSSTPIDNEDSCIVKVVGGSAKSLALSLHGNLYAFGCQRDYVDKHIRERPLDVNVPDKNGRKYPFGFNETPVHLPVPVKVIDMATGAVGNAAIGVDEQLYTWGVGTMGELGRPLPDAKIRRGDELRYDTDVLDKIFLKPTIVPAIRGKFAISVACGQGHLMVVVREPGQLESTVWASGLNKDGQLGLGDTENRKILTPLHYTKAEGMMIKEVKAGVLHTLALSLDGKRLYACGRNDYGQCGVSGEVSAPDAKETKLKLVQFPDDDVEIEQIACGESHNLAIAKPKKGHAEVYTWGSTVPVEEACCLGHGEIEKNEYRPRKLVLRKSDGTKKGTTKVEGGVWRQVSGGSQHSAFLYTSATKSK